MKEINKPIRWIFPNPLWPKHRPPDSLTHIECERKHVCLCTSLPAIVMKLEREVHVWFMAVSGLKAPLLHKREALPKHTIYHSHLSSHHPSLFMPRLISSLPMKTLSFCPSQWGVEQEVFNLAVIYWTGLEAGRDRLYPEGLKCGCSSRWGTCIVLCSCNKTEDYGLHIRL